ncbi:MAG TPA: hypothetical protein PLO67_23110 [Saprospiraceae bacterium]|nr:hypothetical protein [Saprospiraceae bacterium]
MRYIFLFSIVVSVVAFLACTAPAKTGAGTTASVPRFVLTPADTFRFNNFVDCNMAEAWIGDTFRIFPGKYGEDPVWGGYSRELKFSDGRHADEAFSNPASAFTEPKMPANAPAGTPGLHGAVWFETVYQDSRDASGRTLFAIYHNENYPVTLPYNASTGEGYIDRNWPQGLQGAASPAAVCRIGVMKSTDGGRSWANKGLFIEDKQPRMILKPHNNSVTFAGGVGDPSAVAHGDYLYLFYGEYGYPGVYDSLKYAPSTEWSGQCVSMARIRLSDLDNPQGKARRWDGKAFAAPWDGAGKPVASLQIPLKDGGGAASSPTAGHHWGPSVSWNTYLHCWVMLMAKATGPSWQGSSLYISFNTHEDLGSGMNSQDWSKPQLLADKPGHTMWYPSLQPMNTPEDIAQKNTCLRLGKKARLFYKYSDLGKYVSEYTIEFVK